VVFQIVDTFLGLLIVEAHLGELLVLLDLVNTEFGDYILDLGVLNLLDALLVFFQGVEFGV
jgi:hypothetical protein